MAPSLSLRGRGGRGWARLVVFASVGAVALILVSVISGWYGDPLARVEHSRPADRLWLCVPDLPDLAVVTALRPCRDRRSGLGRRSRLARCPHPGTGSSRGLHLQFTSDEIAAVAAGHFPLNDYIPQYTVLLGYPIAPVLDVLGSHAILGVVAWLVLLQIVALIISVALPVLVGGWRMLAPASVVAVLPSLAAAPSGGSAVTYFAVTPMRVVLPAVTLLAAFLMLRRRRATAGLQRGRLVLLGLLCGTTALNNPDYGLPAALIVVGTVLITSPGSRVRVRSTITLLSGLALPFFAYATVGWAIGRPVHWSNWLFFQRTFGAEGTYAVAMAPYGLHIAVVTLFVSAAVIGVLLLTVVSGGRGGFAYRQGVLLTLVGGWSLLCLPYFASRSVTSTLIGGYAYMVGMVVAAFLPLLRAGLRSRLAKSGLGFDGSAAALLMGALAVASVASAIVFVRPASDNIRGPNPPSITRFPALDRQANALTRVIQSPRASRLRQLVRRRAGPPGPGDAQSHRPGRGCPVGAVVSNPVYYDLSPLITKAQCSVTWDSGVRYLLTDRRSAAALELEPTCSDYFNLPATLTFTDHGSTLVLLERAN